MVGLVWFGLVWFGWLVDWKNLSYFFTKNIYAFKNQNSQNAFDNINIHISIRTAPTPSFSDMLLP